MHILRGIMVYTFNPSAWEAETGEFLNFMANLIYIASSKSTVAA